jgi:hypothetical protein
MMLLLALWACGAGPPAAAVSWRESWTILGVTDEGGAVFVEGGAHNQGLLRGQGNLDLLRQMPGDGVLPFRLRVAPIETVLDPEHRGIGLGPHWVGQDDAGWSANLLDADARARLRLSPVSPATAGDTWLEGGGQWRSEVPVVHGRLVGAVTADERGGPLSGWGVALHSGGDGRPALPRHLVVVVGASASLGVEQWGDGRVAWARIDDVELPVGDVRMSLDNGVYTIDFNPAVDLVVSARQQAAFAFGVGDALVAPERWAFRLMSWPTARSVGGLQATLRYQGVERRSRGMWLRDE